MCLQINRDPYQLMILNDQIVIQFFYRRTRNNYFNSVKVQNSAVSHDEVSTVKHCKELGKLSCKQLKVAFLKTVEEIIPDMQKKVNKN